MNKIGKVGLTLISAILLSTLGIGMSGATLVVTDIEMNGAVNSSENVTINNQIIVDYSGYGRGIYTLNISEVVLVGVCLNPVPLQTEVFVGTDEVGVAVWEDQKKDCWVLQEEVIIHIETNSEEDFDVCGRFLFANRTYGTHAICHVNVTEVREMHRGDE